MTVRIGVAAHGSGSDPETAGRFVRALPDDATLFLGGYWGLMRDVAEAARAEGIRVVFILPRDPPVEVPDVGGFIPVDTGLDYQARSHVLVRSSDALAVLGGEIGTILEALLAYSYGRPVVILRRTGMSTDGLEGAFPLGFDRRRLAPVRYVDSPEELAAAAAEAARRAGRRDPRPTGRDWGRRARSGSR